MSDSTSNAGDAKRKRKRHAKVKTGCLTCKIRRKKCDEAKPACNRCISTGRKCDGYAQPLGSSQSQTELRTLPAESESVASTSLASDASSYLYEHLSAHSYSLSGSPHVQYAQHASVYSSIPSQPIHSTSTAGSYCFDFFRNRTGLGFTGYFDSATWQALILRSSYASPTVLKAIIALGAIHRCYEFGITPQPFDFCEVSAKTYQKALHNWKKEIEMESSSQEVTLVLSKLFEIFETFQDNPNSAAWFMLTGFDRVLRQPARTLFIETHTVNVKLNHESLQQFFWKIEQQASVLFGCSIEELWQSVNLIDHNAPIPAMFDTIEQARDVLFNEVRQIWLLPYQPGIQAFQASSIHSRQLGRLMQWSEAYAAFSRGRRRTNDFHHDSIENLLKWYREAAFLQLVVMTNPQYSIDEKSITFCNDPHQFFSDPLNRGHCECQLALVAHFARLQLISDGIVQERYPLDTTALSTGCSTGLGLHLSAACCRGGGIRKQLMALVSQQTEKDKYWNVRGVQTLAGKLTRLEQEATQDHPFNLDPKWVDIIYFSEERKICLVYCRSNPLEQGFDWTREWLDVS